MKDLIYIINYVDMGCCFACMVTSIWIIRLLKKSNISGARLALLVLPLVMITVSLMSKGFERLQGDLASIPSLLRDLGFLGLSVAFILAYKNKTGEL